jgi:hypothetical protein
MSGTKIDVGAQNKSSSDPLLKLANSVNPFFRHYSTPRLFGLLVSIAMLGGVIVLYIANRTCTIIEDYKNEYAPVTGSFIDNKAYIDTFMERPRGLDDSSERTASLCTFYITNYLTYPVVNVQSTTDTYYESSLRACILPPSDYLVAAGFPEAYHFCDLDTVPYSIRSLLTGVSSIPGMEVGKQYSPEEFFHLYWDNEYPGWRCQFQTNHNGWSNAEYAQDCNNKQSSIFYNYCGVNLNNDDTTWYAYSDWPAGTMTMFTHGFVREETISTTVCSSVTGAMGAAIGYIGYIEMLATLVIASLLVGLGISRPVHEDASISGLLKGAGLSEMAEEVEKQKIARQAQEKGGSNTIDDANEGSELVAHRTAPKPL